MNTQEVLKALATVAPKYFDETYVDWSEIGHKYEPFTIDGVAYDVVVNYGGEGLGDERYVIISATTDDVTQYFRIDGWYSSYDGTTFEDPTDLYEVVPEDRVVTFYDKKVK